MVRHRERGSRDRGRGTRRDAGGSTPTDPPRGAAAVLGAARTAREESKAVLSVPRRGTSTCTCTPCLTARHTISPGPESLASDEVARGASSRVRRFTSPRPRASRRTPHRAYSSHAHATQRCRRSPRPSRSAPPRAARPRPRSAGDLAGKRAATIGDRLAKATEGIPKPEPPFPCPR